MAAISSFGALLETNRIAFGTISGFNQNVPSFSSQHGRFHRSPFIFVRSRKASRRTKICMSSGNQKIAYGRDVISPSDILAYDLVQGADVRWSYIMANAVPEPPTAVLLHGILGSRKNWGTFARRLVKEFPKWQFLMVDLRCHGDSAAIEKRGPHNVASAAVDILKLLGQLRLTPRVLVGHSFGGKVALSMVDQVAKPLARPVRVWVLDATPGKVRAGGDGEDHPGELISFLRTLPHEIKVSGRLSFTNKPSVTEISDMPFHLNPCWVASKKGVVDALIQEGFSKDVAQWVVTNLRQTATRNSSTSNLSWAFDLNGIAEMYHSYEETNLWKVVEDVPRGVHINFLKAERSLHRWALKDLQRIHSAEEVAVEGGGGVEMHVLEDAGHWVHADNPDGLFKILSFSFQGV